jgi:hypothetical protein
MAREMSERSFDELARGLAEGSISRRRALGLFAGTAVAALLPSTRALADDDDHDGFTVCHVPGTPPNCDCTRARTIRGLSRRERDRHLRKHPCDSRGNCRNNPYCGTTTTTTSSTTSTSTTPGCLPDNSPCTAESQCCGGICDPTDGCGGPTLVQCSCGGTIPFGGGGCVSFDCSDTTAVNQLCTAQCSGAPVTRTQCFPNTCGV